MIVSNFPYGFSKILIVSAEVNERGDILSCSHNAKDVWDAIQCGMITRMRLLSTQHTSDMQQSIMCLDLSVFMLNKLQDGSYMVLFGSFMSDQYVKIAITTSSNGDTEYSQETSSISSSNIIFDNSGTNLTAVNIDQAIKEVNNRISYEIIIQDTEPDSVPEGKIIGVYE